MSDNRITFPGRQDGPVKRMSFDAGSEKRHLSVLFRDSQETVRLIGTAARELDSPVAPTLLEYFANLVWDARKVLQFSFEVDYRKSDYIAFRNADGVVFLTQMLLRF